MTRKKSDQDDTQYITVRVQLVEVQTRLPDSKLLGYKEHQIGARSYVPGYRVDAFTIYEEMDKLAKRIIGKHTVVSADKKETQP